MGLQKGDRLLHKEELHTLLLLAARDVNRTPLFDAQESPDSPQPLTPYHLITQRDDACSERFCRPTNHSHADLTAYGVNRWKRVNALAAEFEKYWKHYIYQIGTDREKWTEPQRNAKVGDIVLLKEKNSQRLEWPTGTITQVFKDQDNLVRRVIVQTHKKSDQERTPQPKERAIHDLVLLKAITAKDNPGPEEELSLNYVPNELKTLLCQVRTEQREPHLSSTVQLTRQKSPNKHNLPTTQQHSLTLSDKEIFALQNTNNAILNKIEHIRQSRSQSLNPSASPFRPASLHNPNQEFPTNTSQHQAESNEKLAGYEVDKKTKENVDNI